MRVLVIAPAFNRAMSIASVIDSLRRDAPGCDVAVFDDGSTDAAAALVATVFPVSLQRIASAPWMAVPSNAVFALAFVYVLLYLLAATITLSGHAARIRRIAQECTLLRADLDALRARVERGGGGCA